MLRPHAPRDRLHFTAHDVQHVRYVGRLATGLRHFARGEGGRWVFQRGSTMKVHKAAQPIQVHPWHSPSIHGTVHPCVAHTSLNPRRLCICPPLVSPRARGAVESNAAPIPLLSPFIPSEYAHLSATYLYPHEPAAIEGAVESGAAVGPVVLREDAGIQPRVHALAGAPGGEGVTCNTIHTPGSEKAGVSPGSGPAPTGQKAGLPVMCSKSRSPSSLPNMSAAIRVSCLSFLHHTLSLPAHHSISLRQGHTHPPP